MKHLDEKEENTTCNFLFYACAHITIQKVSFCQCALKEAFTLLYRITFVCHIYSLHSHIIAFQIQELGIYLITNKSMVSQNTEMFPIKVSS